MQTGQEAGQSGPEPSCAISAQPPHNSPLGDPPECLADDGLAHLTYAMSSLDEGDRNLGRRQACLDRPPGQVNLEAIAHGFDVVPLVVGGNYHGNAAGEFACFGHGSRLLLNRSIAAGSFHGAARIQRPGQDGVPSSRRSTILGTRGHYAGPRSARGVKSAQDRRCTPGRSELMLFISRTARAFSLGLSGGRRSSAGSGPPRCTGKWVPSMTSASQCSMARYPEPTA